MLGVDYAGARPGGAAIAAAGYGFAARYLSDGGPGLPGKLLLPSEAADLQANGVDIVSNWETTATRLGDGYGAGVSDAQAAWAQHKACGGPDNRPIYFSADWDVQPADVPNVLAYLDGAASVVGVANVGVYGGYRAVSEAMGAGKAQWSWQTDAWSYGQTYGPRNIHQRIGTVVVGGIGCDVNEALTPDFGQWSHGGDTSMSAADVAALSARLDQIVQFISDNFKGASAQADHNRDLLAGFTQSTVNGAVKSIPVPSASSAVAPDANAVVNEMAARLAPPKAGA